LETLLTFAFHHNISKLSPPVDNEDTIISVKLSLTIF